MNLKSTLTDWIEPLIIGSHYWLRIEFSSGTPCEQLKRSINHYGDVVGALTDFTKKFLQERNIFRRQKNHRLADLRMIDDQIKSDCFIENCTMEDMDNALSYLGKAKYGKLAEI